MQEPTSNAKPIEVGGILRRIVGTKEADERIKRVKFKHERRRLGKEHELLLSLEEAMLPSFLLLKRAKIFEFIYRGGGDLAVGG